MNLGRFMTAAAAFAVAALALALGRPGSAGPGTAAAAAVTRAGSAASAPRSVVLDCTGQAQVRPGTIVLACADNGIGLIRLHWTSWTPELASAYGTEWQNDCRPNCAQGHIHHYPVVTTLWDSASVPGHPGERRYAQATLSYPKRRPAVYAAKCSGRIAATYPVSQTLPLGA